MSSPAPLGPRFGGPEVGPCLPTSLSVMPQGLTRARFSVYLWNQGAQVKLVMPFQSPAVLYILQLSEAELKPPPKYVLVPSISLMYDS